MLKRKRFSFIDFIGYTSCCLYITGLLFLDGSQLFKYLVIIVCLLLAINLVVKNTFSINVFVFFWICFLLYFVFNTFVLDIPHKTAAVQRLSTTFLNFFVCFLIFCFATKKRHYVLVLFSFIIISFVFLIYLFAYDPTQMLSMNLGIAVPYLFNVTGSNGIYINSNGVARFFCSAVFCSFFLIKNGHLKKVYKRLLLIPAIIFTLAVIMTGSRGSLFLIAIFYLFIFIISASNYERMFVRLALSFFFVFASYNVLINVPVFYNAIGSKLESFVSGFIQGKYQYGTTEDVRNEMRIFAEQMFIERPLFGWGLDAFAQTHVYELPSHNNFLELLVSGGIFGFFMYYAAIAYLLYMFFIHIKNDPASIVCFSFLLAIVIMGLTMVDYFDRQSLFVLFMMNAKVVGDKKLLKKKPLFHRNIKNKWIKSIRI